MYDKTRNPLKTTFGYVSKSTTFVFMTAYTIIEKRLRNWKKKKMLRREFSRIYRLLKYFLRWTLTLIPAHATHFSGFVVCMIIFFLKL